MRAHVHYTSVSVMFVEDMLSENWCVEYSSRRAKSATLRPTNIYVQEKQNSLTVCSIYEEKQNTVHPRD